MKTGLTDDIEDASVVPITGTNLSLVKNLDIFTPIVDDPEIQGEIAACNVTNDVFAMNVPEINGGMLVFLGIKNNMPLSIIEGILRGIKNFLERKINSKIVGGHTIFCGWPLIGGEASGFAKNDWIIKKSGVKNGDKLILTKPIGLQGVMASYRLLKEMPEVLNNYSKSELNKSINTAIKIMTTSNQNIVKTIHSIKDFSFIHAMSDVTGFGLAGHIEEMLQNSKLSALINKIPSIKFSKELSAELGYAFDECKSHEIAGGMLMAVDPKYLNDFTNNLSSNKIPNWTIGEIEKRDPKLVRISENVKHIEINDF